MGKYDVQIDVKARDAVGPGLDSAKQKITKLGSSVEDLANRYIKFGGIEASFKGLAGVVDLLKGNTEDAMRAFESLPFGIGPAIGAVRGFVESMFGANKETQKVLETLQKVREAGRALDDELAVQRADGVQREIIQLEQQMQKRIDKLDAEIRDISKQRFDDPVLEIEARGLIEQRFNKSLELVEEFRRKRADLLAEDARKQQEEASKAQEKQAKEEKDAFDKRIQQQMEYIRESARVQQEGLADWNEAVGKMTAQANAAADQAQTNALELFGFRVNQQIHEIEQARSKTAFAAGSQSRFLTGVADVSRELMVAQQSLDEQKQMKEVMKQLLDEFQRQRANAVQLISGVF